MNIKIINAGLKSLVKVPTQKVNFTKIFTQIRYSKSISKAFQISALICFNIILSFLNSSLPFFFLHFFFFTWNIFLCLAFRSSHFWLDIQAWDVHVKTLRGHSNIEDTRKVLGYLGTRRALGGHLGTRGALGHLRHLGTWTLRALRHLGT